jgi:hypothetical protein
MATDAHQIEWAAEERGANRANMQSLAGDIGRLSSDIGQLRRDMLRLTWIAVPVSLVALSVALIALVIALILAYLLAPTHASAISVLLTDIVVRIF